MTQSQNSPGAMPPASWQGGAVEYPRDTPVHRLFEAQAAATPDAIALIHAAGYLTYSQLNTQANHLAHHLLSLPASSFSSAEGRTGPPAWLQPSSFAVCLDRSPDLIVTLLAILKAGACYVPLDPAYPAARLQAMAQDSQASLIITTRPIAAILPDLSAPLLFLEDLSPAITPPQAANISIPKSEIQNPKLAPPPNPDLPVPPTAPAYIMFTSGSTGRAKGVAIPHRAIVRLVRGQDYATLTPEETFLQLAPASFDASTLEIWGPLLNGGRLAIAPPGPLSLGQIADAIRGFGVTSLWLTSGLFNLVADEQLNAFAPLRQLLVGGDVLSIPHLRKVRAAHPRLRLINGYGPTESTTFACCHDVTDADLGLPSEIQNPKSEIRNPKFSATPESERPERADFKSAIPDQQSAISPPSIPIGAPIANTSVRILDEQRLPVPIGEPGELYIGGDGLALGYWKQPALTAEKFIQLDGETFYRTGDRVRWLPSGLIEFLGRQDHQVKIRGYRVELAEIETILAEQPGVLRCAVIALGDGADKQLAAYHTGPAEPSALRESLRHSLPDHMVPTYFTRLESLPLTENGKLDRASLPSPLHNSDFIIHNSSAPSNDLERSLTALWSAVLPHPSPGLHDNFFDIGGTSLKLVEAHSRLVRLLRRQIPVTALFQFPTIASLAAFLAPDAASPANAAPASRLAAAANRARMQREALARKQLPQKVP